MISLREGTKFPQTTEALLTKIDTIIFDLGGVILNIDYERTQKAFYELGFPNFDQLYTKFKQSELFVNLEKGFITSEEFLTVLQSYSLRSVTNQQLIEAWNAMLLDLPPENLTTVQRLRDFYNIYLLSNTNAIHYSRFYDQVEELLGQRSLEAYFHQTYYSHLVGERKPDPSIFRLVAHAHSLSPGKTLFIDDSPQHVEAAKALGFYGHLKDQETPLRKTLSELGLL